MSETTQLGSRNETTQLASRNETTQLVSRNETTQLCTAVERLQPPTTAYDRLQPPATACTACNRLHRLQPPAPPATACNRLHRLYSRIGFSTSYRASCKQTTTVQSSGHGKTRYRSSSRLFRVSSDFSRCLPPVSSGL
ncbi:hypothetical protein TNCV_670631 [Trichonephila clavipes]|nr:hypothetical protein TNCV_670631 [Trichonephila clavipes]